MSRHCRCRSAIVKELKKYYGVGSPCRTLLYCLRLAALYYFFTSPTIIKDREFNALLADKAFDADWLLEELNEGACQAVIAPTSKRKLQRAYDRHMYK